MYVLEIRNFVYPIKIFFKVVLEIGSNISSGGLSLNWFTESALDRSHNECYKGLLFLIRLDASSVLVIYL